MMRFAPLLIEFAVFPLNCAKCGIHFSNSLEASKNKHLATFSFGTISYKAIVFKYSAATRINQCMMILISSYVKKD